MACAVCEHCHSPVLTRHDMAIREGFSYHKKCHKCYVCSETNLHNAEVFKGVIFCASCAQRIFQGCASVRKTKQQVSNRAKQQVSNRVKHSRSHSRRRRDRRKPKTQEKRVDRGVGRTINGVIELAQLAGSTSGSCNTVDTNRFVSKVIMTTMPVQVTTTTVPVQVATIMPPPPVEHQGYDMQPKKSLKTASFDMATTTVVTQKLLKQINDPEIASFINPGPPQLIPNEPVSNIPGNITPIRHRKKKKDIAPPRPNKQIVSDLRIAELGASTEIANMALRKKSELPVIIKSDAGLKEVSSDTLSVLNQESAESKENKDWVDSYSTIDGNKISCLDRRLGSLIKMPYKFFKKNILARSSLISIAMSNEDDNMYSNLVTRFKTLFYEEITEHRGRGIRRLYSTINRRKQPYKLGWLNLVAKVNESKAITQHNVSKEKTPTKIQSIYDQMPKKPCKHFKTSHSYRCMRSQAMRLAGPTPSELYIIRQKIKKFVAPKCVRKIARGFTNHPQPKQALNQSNLQTVFKAPPKKPENAWGNIGKAYVHLWSTTNLNK